jgi:hypothetical protein
MAFADSCKLHCMPTSANNVRQEENLLIGNVGRNLPAIRR